MAINLAAIEAAVEAILLAIGEATTSAVGRSFHTESATQGEILASLTAP